MKKEITVKLPKNPESFLYKESVFNYVIMLEDEGGLSELPKNLFVYHVISLFADEVNNGGVEQYLENSSGKTYRELRACARYLSHEVITPFLLELCDYIDAGNKNLEEFDDRFYEIEKKHDFRKAALKYYKENFEAEKITIPVIKEKESDTCKYFKVTKEEKCKDFEVAIKAFLDILGGYKNHRWSIELWYFLDAFRITAFSYGEIFDLKKILSSWNDNDGLRNERIKLCDFAKEIRWYIDTQEENDIYQNYIVIQPSGYEKNEYKLKYCRQKITGATNAEVGKNMFSIWHISHTKNRELCDNIREYLYENYKKYPNIEEITEDISKWVY